jgi:serine/threonine protein kinase
MDISKIKVIKKLGAGMLGTVYLIEYDNKQYAMKVQKILEEEKKKNTKSMIWREILFYRDVNKMSPESQKFFSKLYSSKIIENCKHTQVRPKNLPAMVSFLNKMNKSNICIILVIDYKGSTNLYNFLQKKLSTKQIYSILLQVCKILLLLEDIKYSHNDLHPGNIMVHSTKDKNFEIMGHRIPYNGFQLVAIDYGSMTHEKYYEIQKLYYFFELTKSLFYILQNKPKLEINCRIQKKKYPYEININYENIFWRKLLIKHDKIIDEYAEKYLRLYPYLRNFYNILKKNFKKKSINNIKKNMDNKNDICVFLHKIENHFALEYPEEYMKLVGWCSPPEYMLPKNDVLKILECKTLEDYFKFFKEKLK